MSYEVFDTRINKLFGVFDTEEEALALVRVLVGADEAGRAWADDLAVSHERPDGSFDEPLSGTALLARIDMVLAPASAGSA